MAEAAVRPVPACRELYDELDAATSRSRSCSRDSTPLAAVSLLDIQHLFIPSSSRRAPLSSGSYGWSLREALHGDRDQQARQGEPRRAYGSRAGSRRGDPPRARPRPLPPWGGAARAVPPLSREPGGPTRTTSASSKRWFGEAASALGPARSHRHRLRARRRRQVSRSGAGCHASSSPRCTGERRRSSSRASTRGSASRRSRRWRPAPSRARRRGSPGGLRQRSALLRPAVGGRDCRRS